MKRLTKFSILCLTLLFVPALMLGGCSDDPAATVDAGKDSNPFKNDVMPGQETKPQGDTYVWPDTKLVGDMWQWPDLYSGTPFGCQSDADCFGRQCCATPWGVKVCADSCTP